MVASFASLPTELVTRIVDMVHEHDQAWTGISFRNSGFHERREFDHLRDRPPSSHFDSWKAPYGRGVQALLRVDRRIRAAAVPHFYERLTTRTSDTSYFRFHILGRPLGQHVRHLDCVQPAGALGAALLALACALHALPNVTSISIESSTLSLARSLSSNDKGDVLAVALESALGRVTSLQLSGSSPRAIEYALSHVDKKRLRRLAVKHAASLVPSEDKPVANFGAFEALVEVELGGSKPEDRRRLQECLRLPHVRTLTIVCGFHENLATYEDALVFAHHVAPAVETLTIVDIREVTGGQLPPTSLSPLLPTLRTLRLELRDPYSLDFLHLPDLPAVEHLHITHLMSDAVHALVDLAPTRPTALRTVTSSYESQYPFTLAPEDMAEWDRLGIRIIDEWSPSSYDWRRFVAHEEDADDAAVDEMEDAEEGVEALARLFGWATERARWLLRVGDGHGLDELSDMARRLRERFVIELS